MVVKITQREGKYIAPPWIKYPTYPEQSSFWKSGSGAEYLLKYREHIEDEKEYSKLFPKAPTFTEELTPDDSLSSEAKEYLESSSKPLFVKLWTSDAKPKYDVDANEDGVIIMYDTLITDDSSHIHIGTKVYHSVNEIVELLEKEIIAVSPKLWEELEYTVLLNAIYYKFVSDINFTKEVIKTNDRTIVFKSDNLKWGVEENSEGVYVGNNLLGLAVMELRDILVPVFENYDDIDWNISGEPYSEEHCACGHAHGNHKNPYYH